LRAKETSRSHAIYKAGEGDITRQGWKAISDGPSTLREGSEHREKPVAQLLSKKLLGREKKQRPEAAIPLGEGVEHKKKARPDVAAMGSLEGSKKGGGFREREEANQTWGLQDSFQKGGKGESRATKRGYTRKAEVTKKMDYSGRSLTEEAYPRRLDRLWDILLSKEGRVDSGEARFKNEGSPRISDI